MGKIAISLPDDLLAAVERERLNGDRALSRSEFIRTAVKHFLRAAHEREMEEQYVKGYLEQPETPEETEWKDETARQVFSNNPWDEEDED